MIKEETQTKSGGLFLKRYMSGETQYNFWDFVSKGVGFFTTYLTILSLTVYQYGVFQLLLSIYAGFSAVTTLGSSVVYNDIRRHAGLEDETKAKRLFFEYMTIRLILTLFFSFFLFFGASLLSFKYNAETLNLVYLLSILLVLESISVPLKSLLTLRLYFKHVASRATVSKFFQLLSLAFYFFFMHNLGVREVILSIIAGSVGSIVFLIRPAIRAYKPWSKIKMYNEPLISKIFKTYGKWDIIGFLNSKLSTYIQPWAVKIFVGTEAVAIFSIAQTMYSTIAGLLPVKTFALLLPTEISDPNKIQKIYNISAKYGIFFSILTGVGAVIFSGFFIGMFFPQYILSLPYFYAMSLLLPVTAVSSIMSVYLLVYRKQKFLFILKLFKTITGLVLYVLLVRNFGLWGMVFQTYIIGVSLNVLTYFYIKKKINNLQISWSQLFTFTKEDRNFIKHFYEFISSRIKKKLKFV